MSDQWYIKTTNGKRGPYTMKQLQRYVDAGAIRPNAGIGDGEGEWVAAATVGGLTFSPEVIAKLRSGIQAAAKSSTSARKKSTEAVQPKESASNASTSSSDAQRENLEAKAKELSAKAAEIDERAAALDDRNAELEARNNELQTLAAELDQRQNELQEQAAKQTEEIQSQREVIDAEQLALERQTKDAEQAAVDHENRSAELESRSKELDEQVAEFEAQREEWQAALAEAEAEAEANSQSESDAQLASLTEELETARRQQETAEEKVAALESEKAELSQRLEELQTECEVHQQALVDREEALETSKAELEAAKSDSNEKLAELQLQLESLTKEGEDVQARRAQQEVLGEELEQQGKDLAQREALLSGREDEIQQQQGELEQQQSELERRQREFDSVRESQSDGGATSGVLAAGAVAAAGFVATSAIETTTEETDSVSSERTVELAELRAELASARLLIEEKETQLARAETLLDEARKESSVDDEGATELARDDAPVAATEVTPESILEEKRKLLRQFALRQESLSRREAELIVREEELTERELSIAKIKADAFPKESLQQEPDDSAMLELDGMHDEESFEQTEDSIDLDASAGVLVVEEDAENVLHDSAILQEPSIDEPAIDEPATSHEPDPPMTERLLPQETPEVMEAWPAVATDASDVGADEEDDALQDWLELDDEVSAKDKLPSEEYKADSQDELSQSVQSQSADSRHGQVEGVPSGLTEDAIELGLSDAAPPEETAFSRWPTPKRQHHDVPPDDALMIETGNGAAEELSDELSTASSGELSAFRRSVYQQRFGECDRYVADEDPVMSVDLSIHLPFGARDFTTVVTSGMSDYPIPMPNGQRSVRAELLLYSTQVDDLAMEVIRAAAKVPYLKKQGLSIGSTCSLADGGFAQSSGTQQDAVFMMPIIEDDSTPIPAKELVGNSIQLFWLLTITQAERKLIETQGIHKFLGLLEKHNHTRYFDPTRECYVKRRGWFRR